MVANFTSDLNFPGRIEWIPSDEPARDVYTEGPDAWTYYEAPKPWNGEGLPPVGTVCEVQHPDKSDTWCKCTILVWDSECAVFSADANYPFAYDGNGYPESFRQIRTLEQIAAEERESEIKAMADIYRDAPGLGVESRIAALYDAGYRKFEIVEDDV